MMCRRLVDRGWTLEREVWRRSIWAEEGNGLAKAEPLASAVQIPSRVRVSGWGQRKKLGL
jgi:hypothetical protein